MRSSHHQKLLQRLRERSAVIGIAGLGYVGLPLAMCFRDAGYRVVGFDNDPGKVASLNSGRSYIERIPHSAIEELRRSGFEATGDYACATQVDALIVCVPTPLTRHQEPDLSYVLNTLESFLPHLRPGQIVSLESTTYPGTTDEEIKPRLESRGLRVGEDVFLVFSPEREDPGNPRYSTRTIPKVCGGVTADCLAAGLALYEHAIETVVPVSSARTAEMAKLLENIHRAVNIGLVNEMKLVADKMGIDIHEVIRAAATKPFGFVPYYPGPGLGGHCIPIDPFYLTWKAKEYGVYTRFIELAGQINSAMPEWVVGKIADALNGRGKALNGSRILVLGISYKKNMDDMRESPSVEIMEILRSKGSDVSYSDPHVPVFPRIRDHAFDLSSVPLTAETLSSYDCVVIATNHDKLDYELIRRYSTLIVDTRGVYLHAAPNIVKA